MIWIQTLKMTQTTWWKSEKNLQYYCQHLSPLFYSISLSKHVFEQIKRKSSGNGVKVKSGQKPKPYLRRTQNGRDQYTLYRRIGACFNWNWFFYPTKLETLKNTKKLWTGWQTRRASSHHTLAFWMLSTISRSTQLWWCKWVMKTGLMYTQV